MRKKGKRTLLWGTAALMLSAVLCIGCAAQGPTVGNQPSQGEEGSGSESSAKLTLSEWAEAYPLQYDSFATLKTKGWTDTYEGHYSLGLKLLAPVSREGNTVLLDENGDMAIGNLTYDYKTGQWVAGESKYSPLESRLGDVKGCYQCKTSNFNDLLAESGESMAAEPLDQEFLDAVDGQIWDCYLCHTGNPEDGYDSTITMFSSVMGDVYDDLTPEDRVCGQCHNHVVHKPMFQSGMAWSDYQPFKYGFDVDSVLKSAQEYDLGTYEESTGITTYRSSHAELEITLDSNHRSLGVTCIDCHMPDKTDGETGQMYSDHNASGSPLENEAALEYCLTCHKAQGIDSTEQMVEMVKALQDETAQTGKALEEKLADLHDLIEEANQAGTMDSEKLDEARTLYTQAKFYLEWGTFGNGSGYVKVAHNPELITSLMQRSSTVIDEALALFA